jgi:hypothetical protein
MDSKKLQDYIREWLKHYHEPAQYKTILEQAATPRTGKQWTDAIQYYVRGVSAHNPRKREIRAACQELLKPV